MNEAQLQVAIQEALDAPPTDEEWEMRLRRWRSGEMKCWRFMASVVMFSLAFFMGVWCYASTEKNDGFGIAFSESISFICSYISWFIHQPPVRYRDGL